MEYKLKSCPFCGGKARLFDYDPFDGYQGDLRKYKVKCTMCEANIERHTLDGVMKVWNRRKNNERAKAN